MTAVKKTNVITMKDGREVDFGSRGKLKKNVVISGEGAERKVTIDIDCINGDTHQMVFDATDPLFFEYAAHGVSQKLTDAITKAEDYDDVSFGVSNQIEQLKSGKWTVRNTDGMARGFSDLLEALRRIRGYDVGSAEAEGLRVNLVAKTEEQMKFIKTNSGVKAVIATILSEKAAARAAKLMEDSEETGADLTDLI